MTKNGKKYLLYGSLWSAMQGAAILAITDSIPLMVISAFAMSIGCLIAAEIIMGRDE